MKLVLKTSIIFIFLLACSFTSSYAQAQDEDRGYIVKIGDMAPDISLPMFSRDTIALSSLKGKVVVLQFTASWCGVCRQEMPHLEKEVWLENKDKDFVLIGIDIDEDESKVAPFIEKMKVTYPIALDTEKEIFYQFAAKKAGVTRNVVLDQSGKIVFLTRLFDPVEFDAMKAKIDQLLK